MLCCFILVSTLRYSISLWRPPLECAEKHFLGTSKWHKNWKVINFDDAKWLWVGIFFRVIRMGCSIFFIAFSLPLDDGTWVASLPSDKKFLKHFNSSITSWMAECCGRVNRKKFSWNFLLPTSQHHAYVGVNFNSETGSILHALSLVFTHRRIVTSLQNDKLFHDLKLYHFFSPVSLSLSSHPTFKQDTWLGMTHKSFWIPLSGGYHMEIFSCTNGYMYGEDSI